MGWRRDLHVEVDCYIDCDSLMDARCGLGKQPMDSRRHRRQLWGCSFDVVDGDGVCLRVPRGNGARWTRQRQAGAGTPRWRVGIGLGGVRWRRLLPQNRVGLVCC